MTWNRNLEPGALLVDRHVAELVDDQEPRLGDLPELRVEPVLALRAAQPHEQPGRGREPGLSAIARLAAATALPKPAAAHAAPIDLRLCARRLESASSSHARTSSGKSGRIDDSPQDPGLAASTGMASSGSCSVDGLRPYIRGYPATISPVPGSVICTLSQRTAARSLLPGNAGPARYRFESMSICPYCRPCGSPI